MSNIVEARNILAAMSHRLSKTDPALSAEINAVLPLLFRNSYKARKAKASSVPMTSALAAAIRAHVKAHPDTSHQAAGNIFGVNPGRVSDALAGRW